MVVNFKTDDRHGIGAIVKRMTKKARHLCTTKDLATTACVPNPMLQQLDATFAEPCNECQTKPHR
jgi:hypothetical protein